MKRGANRAMATDPLSCTPDPATTLSSRGSLRELPDSELMRRLALQDESAIEELYSRYSALVFSIAHHVLNDVAAAEDIAQEIFLQLWRNPSSFDPERGALSTWFTVITRHRAIDRCRRRRAEVDVSDLIIPIDGKQHDEASCNEAMQKIGSALAEMPANLRVTFELAYLHGLTHSEISARNGAPLGTTKSRIRLALQWLRKK